MDYKKLLKELNITIIWVKQPLENGAWYCPNATNLGKNGVIFIFSGLEEHEITEKVIHEIGHYKTGSTIFPHSIPNVHVKNEGKARRFTLKQYLLEYLDSDIDYSMMSISGFLDYFGLDKDFYWDDAVKIWNEF
ncbi:hypothetical protein AALM99_08000 [Lactococcus muris]|uniref:IrrE N-terminal-like domain-containing protein n=1 Tax=Lactococcus muris TaxID=2941330 RepID=A0ABV4D9E2_9LACT